MKKIEDYLHLYIGQEVKVPGGIVGLTHGLISRFDFKHYGMKLLLRPLSSITKDEVKESTIKNYSTTYTRTEDIITIDIKSLSPNQFRYLLNKGLDLFGLIESGIAIDKTKVKPINN